MFILIVLYLPYMEQFIRFFCRNG